MIEERNCLDKLTFEEANENMESFGLEFAFSICEHCKHWNKCIYSDYQETRNYETSLIIKCDFYEEGQ